MQQVKYRRVLLKISGEGLCRSGGFGIDGEVLGRMAGEIKLVADLGVQLCIVVGGGNIIRGSSLAKDSPIEEVTGHYMGMLATVINALAIQDTLESLGLVTRVQSAVAVDRVCEPFTRRRALRHLEKGRIVIFAGGTGNPFVTTDSGGALRASEMQADVLLKATKVDGVYTADPMKDPNARKIDRLTYREVIDKRLAVMDVAAVELCRQNRVPIIVFNLYTPGNMRAVCEGRDIGTRIDGD
ncbi:MAG: UMP kinase [Phycisphaerae bacterium]|nr:MAG: UMP kinase [Planctomycetota bacterium]KAB2940136.1 MAG: UMP kinase [Phycisphaerae bacterium]MBE7455764.1 UMP kinase [Planctomycetia bacterium]MCK6463399.1 UMP kinase [Phycisphaerae bacterium]MCL4717021.1 UMP kinase [Phycisphaerae bacterium]